MKIKSPYTYYNGFLSTWQVVTSFWSCGEKLSQSWFLHCSHPFKHNEVLPILSCIYLLKFYLSLQLPTNSLSLPVWNPKCLSQPSNAHLLNQYFFCTVNSFLSMVKTCFPYLSPDYYCTVISVNMIQSLSLFHTWIMTALLLLYLCRDCCNSRLLFLRINLSVKWK